MVVEGVPVEQATRGNNRIPIRSTSGTMVNLKKEG
jgi:hypothetical protein